MRSFSHSTRLLFLPTACLPHFTVHHAERYISDSIGYEQALRSVNANPTILPGITLKTTFVDSGCKPSMAVSASLTLIATFDKQAAAGAATGVGFLGAACSGATQAMHPVIVHYDYLSISPSASSPALINYPNIYRVAQDDTRIGWGFAWLCNHYGWKRVYVIKQAVEISTLSMASFEKYVPSRCRRGCWESCGGGRSRERLSRE